MIFPCKGVFLHVLLLLLLPPLLDPRKFLKQTDLCWKQSKVFVIFGLDSGLSDLLRERFKMKLYPWCC